MLLSPLRKQYDQQRRLWYLGAHGTLNNIIMLEFDQCPQAFLGEGEVDVWTCLFAYLFHCTPLSDLRIAPRLVILAHFVWATRTVLLQYWRTRSEDELADCIPGAWNVPSAYLEALSGLCYDGTIWNHAQWKRLLDIVTVHDMAAAFRSGERRAWLWFSVKFLEGVSALVADALTGQVGADTAAQQQALSVLDSLRDVPDAHILSLGAQLVVIGKDLAHQLPWGPGYEDACGVMGREPQDGVALPWYEGDELAHAYTAWHARVRARIAAGQAALECDGAELAALWRDFLGEASKASGSRAFACSTPEFPPRARWLADCDVIRAETEEALAYPDADDEATPHATPRLSPATPEPGPELDDFDLDERRMPDHEQLLLALQEDAEYLAEKRAGKQKAKDQDQGHDELARLSPELSRALKKTVQLSRTWQPVVEEQVEVWREEHGYEHHVPCIPRSAYEALKDDVVLQHAESLVGELRLAYEINAMDSGHRRSDGGGHDDQSKSSGSGEAEHEEGVALVVKDVAGPKTPTVETLPTDVLSPAAAMGQSAEVCWAEDGVVTIMSEKEYQAMGTDQASSPAGEVTRPRSIGYDVPIDTAGNPADESADEDPFAFHNDSETAANAFQGYDVPSTPRLPYLAPPGIELEPALMAAAPPMAAPMPPPLAPEPIKYRRRRKLEYLHNLDMPPVSRKNVRGCPPIAEVREPREVKMSKEDYERERADLHNMYEALSSLASLAALTDSDSDSDSDDGWGDAELEELFFTPTRPLSPKKIQAEVLEPIASAGACSPVGAKNGQKSSETGHSAIAKYESYPLSDSEEDEPDTGKKNKCIDNGKRQVDVYAELADFEAALAADPWNYADYKVQSATGVHCSATSAAGSSAVSITASERIPSSGSDDYGIVIPIEDLTGANGSSGGSGSGHGLIQAAGWHTPELDATMEGMTSQQLARCIPNGEKYLWPTYLHHVKVTEMILAGSYMQALQNGDIP